MKPAIPAWQSFDPSAGDVPETLRQALIPPDDGGQVVTVAAAPDLQEEGWSARAAVRLAELCSDTAPRVLLVDLDLDSPSLARELGVPVGEGITDVFLYGASVQRVSQAVREGAFLLASTGTVAADPAVVLGDPGWAPMLKAYAGSGATVLLYARLGMDGAESVLEWADRVVFLGGAEDDPDLLLPEGCVPTAWLGPEQEGAPVGAEGVADSPTPVEEPFEEELPEEAPWEGAEDWEEAPDDLAASAPSHEDEPLGLDGGERSLEGVLDEAQPDDAPPLDSPHDADLARSDEDWEREELEAMSGGGDTGDLVEAAWESDVGEVDLPVDETTPEGLVTEDVVTEEVVTEEVVAEDVVTEDVVTEEAVTEEVVTEDVMTEDVVTEDLVTDEVAEGVPAGSGPTSDADADVGEDLDPFWDEGAAAVSADAQPEHVTAPEDATAEPPGFESGTPGVTGEDRPARSGRNIRLVLMAVVVFVAGALVVWGLFTGGEENELGGRQGEEAAPVEMSASRPADPPASGQAESADGATEQEAAAEPSGAVTEEREADSRTTATEPPGAPVTPTPFETANPSALRFGLTINAHERIAAAEEQAGELAGRFPDLQFVVVPVTVDGRTFYRVLAGPAASATEADALRARMSGFLGSAVARGAIVRSTRFAYLLGEFGELPEAEARRDRAEAAGIPAYVVESGGGGAPYRVYSGAYASEREATVLGNMLANAGLEGAVFTQRLGRPLR